MINQNNFYIDGIKINNPVNWDSTKVTATFDAQSNVSSITTDRIELVGDAAKQVIDYYQSGSITEGLPYSTELISDGNNLGIFKGYIDFSKKFEIINSQRCFCSLSIMDDIADLRNKMAGTTVDLLLDKRVYTKSDLKSISYVVEKEFNFVDIVVMLVTIYLFLKEIYEAALRLADNIATIAGILAAGITGSVGAAIAAAIQAVANLIYIGVMTVQVIDLVKELFTYFISPKRSIKGISLHNLIKKAIESFGYSFSSEIPELTKYYYFPSLKNENADRGFPNASDFGYTVEEIVTLIEDLFYAKPVVVGKTFYLNWKGSDFWKRQSSFVLDQQSPDKRDRFKPNLSDLKTGTFLNFRDDISDYYTIENFTGTNYSVSVEQKTTRNPKMVSIKGLTEVNIPMSLASRKDRLTDREELLKDVAGIANDLLSVFGGSTSIGSGIDSRIGAMKISQETYNNPKLVYLVGSKISSSQRNKLSAKYLYENYHYWRSFVESPEAQRLNYTDDKYPLTFRNFIKLVGNNRIVDWQGRSGEVSLLEWTFDKSYAEIEFSVAEKYATNLKETKIEG